MAHRHGPGNHARQRAGLRVGPSPPIGRRSTASFQHRLPDRPGRRICSCAPLLGASVGRSKSRPGCAALRDCSHRRRLRSPAILTGFPAIITRRQSWRFSGCSTPQSSRIARNERASERVPGQLRSRSEYGGKLVGVRGFEPPAPASRKQGRNVIWLILFHLSLSIFALCSLFSRHFRGIRVIVTRIRGGVHLAFSISKAECGLG